MANYIAIHIPQSATNENVAEESAPQIPQFQETVAEETAPQIPLPIVEEPEVDIINTHTITDEQIVQKYLDSSCCGTSSSYNYCVKRTCWEIHAKSSP